MKNYSYYHITFPDNVILPWMGRIIMENRENEITRISFVEETLNRRRHLDMLPGFFGNGPEYFGAHLFDRKNYFNVVTALALMIRTRDGDRMLTAIRSENEERQPLVGSAITVRGTHAEARATIDAYSRYRVPILGGEIEDEGYHVRNLAHPVLAADHEPGAKLDGKDELDADEPFYETFMRLIDKTAPDDHEIGQDTYVERLLDKAIIWPGPVLMGVSEVGMYDKWSPSTHKIPLIEDPLTEQYYPDSKDKYESAPIFEANAMFTVMGVVDLREYSADAVLSYFPRKNKHYAHFDLAHPDSFENAVRYNLIDLVAPRLKERSRKEKSMQYVLACPGGMCLRAALVGLERHVIYMQNLLDSRPTAAIYYPPIRLKPTYDTFLTLDEKSDLNETDTSD